MSIEKALEYIESHTHLALYFVVRDKVVTEECAKEAVRIASQNDWLSPIDSIRKQQEEDLVGIFGHYPNAFPLWQYINGLIKLAKKAITQPQWISVKDKLPDGGFPVLVIRPYKDTVLVTVARYDRMTGNWTAHLGGYGKPTYWQKITLPTAPQK